MRLPLFAFVAAIMTLASGAAMACSCLRAESAGQHLERIDLAFVGTVTDVRRAEGDQLVTRFRVHETLKGRAARTLSVRHRTQSAACGMRYKVGERALVLANGSDAEGWRTSLCSAPQFPVSEYKRAASGWLPGHGATCDADAARFAVGQRYSEPLGDRAKAASGAATLRVRRAGQPYTQDRRADRLNLDLDRRSRVARVVCE